MRRGKEEVNLSDDLGSDRAKGVKGFSEGKAGSRAFKKALSEILKSSNLEKICEEISRVPYAGTVGPLFSFLLATDPIIKWRAVFALGFVVSRMAEEEIESARVVMRRLMWQLNDESGGIGWGCPEAMGEIMARSEKMAEEYAHVLRSYSNEEGNFIEHEPLQEGVLWALGRLAGTRPAMVRPAGGDIFKFLKSKVISVRGLALWILSFLDEDLPKDRLEIVKRLCSDEGKFNIFVDGNLMDFTVGELARALLKRPGCPAIDRGAQQCLTFKTFNKDRIKI
jgi:hypothetical protein